LIIPDTTISFDRDRSANLAGMIILPAAYVNGGKALMMVFLTATQKPLNQIAIVV
jgi:hypothetical protein